MTPPHAKGTTPGGKRAANRRRSRVDADPRDPRNSVKPTATDKTAKTGRGGTLFGAALGVLIGAGGIGALSWSSGCSQDRSDASAAQSAGASKADPFQGLPEPPEVPDDANAPVVEEPDPPAVAEEKKPDKPWQGPWLGALAHATPIYPTARFSKNRLGYIRRGGRVPVVDKPIKTKSCRKGFYPLVDGGYVCGKYATTNMADPRVKGGVKPPAVDKLLPYRYAFNRAHGTPLYRTFPSIDEMQVLEPYLLSKDEPKGKGKGAKKKGAAAKKKKPAKSALSAAALGSAAGSARAPRRPAVTAGAGHNASAKLVARASDSVTGKAKRIPRTTREAARQRAAELAATRRDAQLADQPRASTATPMGSAASSTGGQFLSDTGVLLAPSALVATPAPEVPWWQTPKGQAIKVRLADLEQGKGVLAKRMVRGFFIAIDGTVSRHKRAYYKTTEGLLAPADRMIIPKTPQLKGLEMSAEMKQVGFIRNRRAYRYRFNEKGKARRDGKLARFSRFGLSGKTRLYKKHRYRETVDGWWMKESQGTYTEPGPRPNEVGADEKWVDVNVTRRTLVAFVGDTPVYAALISPGKRSKNRRRDHRTKIGKWRIREKHLTTTMDGDGTAGDLPYSIQDVPYVQYYDGSYALHGAFWHRNFGREQSHGCVNLSPHDSKHLFFWTEPQVPKAWHGVWSSSKRRGSLVVVHE